MEMEEKNLTDGGGAKANAASYRLKSLLDTASPKDTVLLSNGSS